ncbi:MAG TPA: PQQ-binding-like beta-propeller repeat protein [Pirellulales bacterium]|nr:PQQ-binding-like beta-propeller repeat protein [Pirellulales bacterium]
MFKRTIAGLFFILLLTPAARAARPLGNVVAQETAHRYGLERAWATRVELDRARGRVAYVSLQAGLLMVQTDQSTVHVLDAETRHTLWVGHVGRPGAVTSPPAANDKFVVSTNGGTLYLFDRPTGKVLWTRNMPSVPSTGPAITNSRIYVPLVTGMISTFRLPSPNRNESPNEQRFKDNALNFAGKGIAYQPPIVTESNVVWGTDAGNVYAVSTEELRPVYRFKAHDAVLGGVMYRPPYLFAASRDGYVYAIRDQKGSTRWQFSIGKPIAETPMATDDGVYVIPETGGLYKLSPDTGEEMWLSRGVFQFIAASPTRIYTADAGGQLLIVDAKSGAQLGTIGTPDSAIKVFNRYNDRIYLVSRTGLVQCLHEVALKEPAWHGAHAVADSEKTEASGDTEASADDKPAADDGPDPFGAEEKMPADEGDDAMEDDAMEDEK